MIRKCLMDDQSNLIRTFRPTPSQLPSRPGYHDHQTTPIYRPSIASLALCARSIFATVPPSPDLSATRVSEPLCQVFLTSPNRSTSPTSIFVFRAASSVDCSFCCNRVSYASVCLLNESRKRWDVSAGAVRRRLASWSVWFSICADNDWMRCASLVSKGSISATLPSAQCTVRSKFRDCRQTYPRLLVPSRARRPSPSSPCR